MAFEPGWLKRDCERAAERVRQWNKERFNMLHHDHVVIRAEVRRPPVQREIIKISLWMSDLIRNLGMTALHGPHVVYSTKENNRGMTGIAAIDTSHIVFHTWDEDDPAVMQLDVYTCKKLDLDVIKDALQRFDPIHVAYHLLDRSVEISSVSQGALYDAYQISLF